MKLELATDVDGVALSRLVRHLDLFSGIGGFALAARMVGGIETVGFCEIDPWARQVLAKNFPGTPIHDDVRTLNPNDYGRIDLITGGYPCQPFSLSGKRRGEEDDRHLWPEIRRIIEGTRPRWVLCENVAGHISMGLDEVLADLDAIGYTATATVIPACAVNAPHRRDRVWIIANCDNARDRTPERNTKHDGAEDSEKREQSQRRIGRHDSYVADTHSAGLEGSQHNEPSHGTVYHKRENWREDWTEVAARVCRVANGLPRRVDRLRGLGNAIVPQVAAEILRCMMRVNSLLPNDSGL